MRDSVGLLFNRFYQTELTRKERGHGIGLGLSIVKGLVEALGGRVWAESEVGKGSTFYVRFPFKYVPIKQKAA